MAINHEPPHDIMFCILLLFPPFWIQTNRSAYLIFIPVLSLSSPLVPDLWIVIHHYIFFHLRFISAIFCIPILPFFLLFPTHILTPSTSHQSTVRSTNFYVKEHFYAYYVTLLLPARIPIRWNIPHLEWSEEKLTDIQS